MKKLIIALFATAVAFYANAAAISWSAAAIANDPTNASASGYSAYFLVVTETMTASSVSAGLADGTVTIADVVGASIYQKTSTYNATAKLSSISSLNNATTFAAGANVSAFAVIFNTTEANVSNATWAMVTPELSKTIADKTATMYGYGTQAGNTWVEIAPEPTSGLLLLLGMAGLALKRKQA